MELTIVLIIGGVLGGTGLAAGFGYSLFKIQEITKKNRALGQQLRRVSEINRELTRQYGDIYREKERLRIAKDERSLDNLALRDRLKGRENQIQQLLENEKALKRAAEKREKEGLDNHPGSVSDSNSEFSIQDRGDVNTMEVNVEMGSSEPSPPMISSPYEPSSAAFNFLLDLSFSFIDFLYLVSLLAAGILFLVKVRSHWHWVLVFSKPKYFRVNNRIAYAFSTTSLLVTLAMIGGFGNWFGLF